jgi:hypothetical protein
VVAIPAVSAGDAGSEVLAVKDNKAHLFAIGLLTVCGGLYLIAGPAVSGAALIFVGVVLAILSCV